MVGHVEHSDLIVQVTADVDSAIDFQNFNNDKQVREIILPPSLQQEFNGANECLAFNENYFL